MYQTIILVKPSSREKKHLLFLISVLFYSLQRKLFEIELLCLNVYTCECCGSTKPYTEGPNSKPRKDTKFHRSSLSDKYYPEFYCNCDICNGQFFCSSRTTHMTAYKEKHNIKYKPPDCMLCSNCYSELASDTLNLFLVGRKFSAKMALVHSRRF